jgi:gamma-glutamyl-gamma-aminobutyrate hydrolase PuuD
MGDRPRIGITRCSKLPDYVASVEQAGGEVRVLDFDESPDEVVRQIDGLVLTGGGDVDPALYGEPRHASVQDAEPGRDRFEIDLTRRAVAADLPILAICRGAQVLNVARGGSLHQHVPDVSDGSVAHRQTESGRATTHPIRIEAGSRLADIVGPGDLDVNAFHHQAVDRLGRGLRAVAWASDGIVEGIEGDGDALYLGVQWHVETLTHFPRHARLFEALVDAASGRRERRAA